MGLVLDYVYTNSMSMSLIDLLSSLSTEGNQSFIQRRVSTVSEAKEERVLSTILRPQLKADSDATVVTGIAKISRAIFARIGNLGPLSFHQCNISNESSLFLSKGNKVSSKYCSNYDFCTANEVVERSLMYLNPPVNADMG